MHLKLVVIEWVNSKGLTLGWEHKDDLEPLQPVRCRFVRFLVDDHDQCNTPPMTDTQTQVLGRLTISAQAIVKIRRLR